MNGLYRFPSADTIGIIVSLSSATFVRPFFVAERRSVVQCPCEENCGITTPVRVISVGTEIV